MAAALAAAKTLRDGKSTDAQVTDVANQYFLDNMKGSGGNIVTISAFNVNIDHVKNAVSLAVNTDVPTLFFNLVGFELPSAAGDEMKNPKKDVPYTVLRAIIVSILLCIGGWILNRKRVNIAFLSIGMDYFQVLALFANSKVAVGALISMFVFLCSF